MSETTIDDDQRPSEGLIEGHLRRAFAANVSGSDSQISEFEDQSFESADTFEEVPQKVGARGGRKFIPTSRHFTDAKIKARKRAFLAALRLCGIIRISAEKAGVSPDTVECWREWDPVFDSNWRSAEEQATDLIEARAVQGATEGYLEPVFQGGLQVGSIRKFEPRLMMFLLETRRRAKYGRRTENLNYNLNATPQVQSTPAEIAASVRAVLPMLAPHLARLPEILTPNDEQPLP